MRLPAIGAIFCCLACWAGHAQAEGCRCAPPAPHHHVVRVVHRYADAGCPIARAHELRPGCGWYYYQIGPAH